MHVAFLEFQIVPVSLSKYCRSRQAKGRRRGGFSSCRNDGRMVSNVELDGGGGEHVGATIVGNQDHMAIPGVPGRSKKVS
jgi:hypothetical protein